MSIFDVFDGLHLCENCGDAYTLGRLCRTCREQEMIDVAEPPAPAEPSALEQAERIAALEGALRDISLRAHNTHFGTESHNIEAYWEFMRWLIPAASDALTGTAT